MTHLTDMATWLRTQIEADRERAYHEWGCPAHPDQWISGPFGPCECATRHVAADCDAKLAILDMHDATVRDFTHATETAREHARREVLEDVIEHLAQGYRHREGYRNEWRP